MSAAWLRGRQELARLARSASRGVGNPMCRRCHSTRRCTHMAADADSACTIPCSSLKAPRFRRRFRAGGRLDAGCVEHFKPAVFYPRQGRPGLALPPISQRSISSKDARSSSVSPGLKLGAATMRTPRRFVCASGCNGSVAQRCYKPLIYMPSGTRPIGDHQRLGTRMRFGVEVADLTERQMGGHDHGLRNR